MRILLVEDEAAIRSFVHEALVARGFDVETAATGEDALRRGAQEPFDVVVLDLNLPDLDGLSVLARWRDQGVATPVLALTARNRWPDRVKGINLGADDYLPKPFQMEELEARLLAVIRRAERQPRATVTSDGATLDVEGGVLRFGERIVELSALESRALSHLMENRGRPVSKRELIDATYGVNARQSPNALEALMKRLRQKLGVELVRTRRGQGYMVDYEKNHPAG